MNRLKLFLIMIFTIFFLHTLVIVSGSVYSSSSFANNNNNNNEQGSSSYTLSHFQPMIAMLCGRGKYHNQYLDENKRWVSDPDPKATCTKDKLEILEYCRKVYPKKDIRNIVEYSRYMLVENWCRVDQRCRTKYWVKPYRCLEGPFQSDALLVPAYCLFDHIHNGSICQSSDYWNRTAAASCMEKRNMKLKSFGMLLPCGVGIFAGVEFVCCPSYSTTPGPIEWGAERKSHIADNQINYKNSDDFDSDEDDKEDTDDVKKEDQKEEKEEKEEKDVKDARDVKDAKYDAEDKDDGDDGEEGDDRNDKDEKTNKERDDKDGKDDKEDRDEDEDEYYDEFLDDDDDDTDVALKSTSTTTTTTTTTTTERPIDHYLSHFDSNREHDSYKAAQKSLEESHRDKVTKVMKEWSELEERYQEMKVKDPKGAADFKKRITARFQMTVEALEEEGSAERRQLVSMHQQRVMTVINMRKKAAMDCYTQSLDQTPLKTKRIEKCLEKLLRALEKDRTHTLHHFRHLLNSNTVQALREKNAILDHLENLLRMARHSILMLDRVPSISNKIKDRIVAFWHNLRGIGVDDDVSRQTEQAILERYEEEVAQKQQERERQKMLKEERQQGLKELEEEKKLVEVNQKPRKLDRDFDPESMEDEHHENEKPVLSPSENEKTESSFDSDDNVNRQMSESSSSSPITQSSATSLNNIQVFAHGNNLESSGMHKIMPTPKISHIHNQGFHHNEMAYSVHKEPYGSIKWNGTVYITLAFAGIAFLVALVVGVVLLRSHRQRSPVSQGFVEVDQAASPEERHVANMQINGYENPTYKYFEAQSA